MEKCWVAITSLYRRRMKVPALNKWIQVWPVIAAITMLLSLHNLLARALARAMAALKTASRGEP